MIAQTGDRVFGDIAQLTTFGRPSCRDIVEHVQKGAVDIRVSLVKGGVQEEVNLHERAHILDLLRLIDGQGDHASEHARLRLIEQTLPLIVGSKGQPIECRRGRVTIENNRGRVRTNLIGIDRHRFVLRRI